MFNVQPADLARDAMTAMLAISRAAAPDIFHDQHGDPRTLWEWLQQRLGVVVMREQTYLASHNAFPTTPKPVLQLVAGTSVLSASIPVPND